VLNLDVEERGRVFAWLEANDFAVNRLAVIERAQPPVLDLPTSLAKHVESLTIVRLSVDQHHIAWLAVRGRPLGRL
jgi:hypothetical protein